MTFSCVDSTEGINTMKMNMEDMLKTKRYCMTFKKVYLLTLFIFLITHNAVKHSQVVKEYWWVEYHTN